MMHWLWPTVYLLGSSLALCHIAVRISGACGIHRHGLLVWAVACLTVFCGLIVTIAQALGYAGLLHPEALLLCALLLAVLSGRRMQLPEMPQAWRTAAGSMRLLAGFMLISLAGLLISAALSTPLDFDSNGYRLSRIGLWLQDHHIRHQFTSDERMNYSAFNGDLLMLWITAPFRYGFPLVATIQTLGGVLLMAATAGLARMLRLDGCSALLAACLPLGMAFFVGQMTTEQVDLLVAGFITAAIFLLYAAAKEGCHPLPGAVAFALALGTKGSFIYFLPGVALLGIVALVVEKPCWQQVGRMLCWLAAMTVLLGIPRYVENFIHYGSPWAPVSEVEKLHGAADSSGFSLEKLRLNSVSYGLQLLTAESNPPLLRDALSPLARSVADTLPAQADAHSVSRSRGEWFRNYIDSTQLHDPSLHGSSGLLPIVAALLGLAFALRAALWRSNRHAWILLSLAVAAALYHICFAGMFKWSPFKFRYYLTVVPILAVLAVYPVHMLSLRWRQPVALLAGLLAIAMGWHSYLNGMWSGLGNFINARSTQTGHIIHHQQAAIDAFLPAHASVAVALPYYAMLSPFFRSNPPIHTTLLPAEQLRGYASAEEFMKANGFDAVVTRANSWADPGNSVNGLAWLGFEKRDAQHNFEMLRRATPGDTLRPFVRQQSVTWSAADQWFIVDWQLAYPQAFAGSPAIIELINATMLAWQVIAPDHSVLATVVTDQSAVVGLPLTEAAPLRFFIRPVGITHQPTTPAIPLPKISGHNFQSPL
jgi:hypothetical protein